ncbi:MAG TPA: alpha/beta hydrolase [Phototrophicaceae bacterium]|nr:alpha/beta hydrolase [Phototrophicaceae bacterium]
MLTAQINGIRLAYEIYGQGEPLLLIHGAIVSHLEWRPQLEALGKAFQLIMPDVRGHGESGSSSEPYSIQQFAEDLFGLLETLGIQQTIVCGHSMGGAIAQQLTIDHPERVRALVLAETIFRFPQDWKLNLRLKVRNGILRLMGLKRLKRLMGQQFGAKSAEDVALLDTIFKPHLTNPANFWNIWKANKGFDNQARLNQIHCPTLILVAENNHATQEQGRIMAQVIPEAQLITIPNAKHGLNWDNPEAFNAAVMEFSKKVTYGR